MTDVWLCLTFDYLCVPDVNQVLAAMLYVLGMGSRSDVVWLARKSRSPAVCWEKNQRTSKDERKVKRLKRAWLLTGLKSRFRGSTCYFKLILLQHFLCWASMHLLCCLEKVNPAREEENRERLLCNLPGSAGQTGNLINLLLFQAREITTLPWSAVIHMEPKISVANQAKHGLYNMMKNCGALL